MVLKEHNQKAYNNMIKSNEEGKNRTCIVHPTGTGKTYIVMKLIKDNPKKRVLIVVPTNAIIDQYIRKLEKENIDYKNVQFITYSKLMNMVKNAKVQEIQADNIVLDEFHHAGAEEWGKGVKGLLEYFDKIPVLGLSATPIRYLDKLRNMAEEIFEGNVVSEITLPEAILDGLLEVPVYHQGIYSIKKEEERLKKQIDGLYEEDVKNELSKKLSKVRDRSSRLESIQTILENGIPEDKKDGKYIVFCRDLKDMHNAMKKASNWFKNINEVEIYSMASKDIDGKTVERKENEEEIKLFENSKSNRIKLMFAINMLNEGIHVENIDGIIMLRGTKSPIVYRQQIGRVLSIGGKKNPLVFDFADNIHCTEYVHELYQDMINITEERRRKGHNINKEKKVLKEFEIEDHIKEIKYLIKELDDNTYKQIWERNFEILKEYIESDEKVKKYFNENGSIKVDSVVEYNGEKINIGKWLDKQRQRLMKQYFGMTIEEIKQDKSIPSINKDRMMKLLTLGVKYSKKEIPWIKMFEQLQKLLNSDEKVRKYFNEKGVIKQDTIVETNGIVFKLGKWFQTQKQKLMRKHEGKTIEEIKQDRNISQLEKDKIIKLLELGVSYKKTNHDREWEVKFNALEKYINSDKQIEKNFKEKGKIKKNTRIILNGKEVKIGKWLETQRLVLMKKYYGKTLKEIEEDKTIPEQDKIKMVKLLTLGVSYGKDINQEWNDIFNAIERYVESNIEVKKYLMETGGIDYRTKLEVNGKQILVGVWINTQKQYIMKRYQGMAIEEIKQDKNIPEEDRRKMIKLLTLGVKYAGKIDELQDKVNEARNVQDKVNDARKLEKKYEQEIDKNTDKNELEIRGGNF